MKESTLFHSLPKSTQFSILSQLHIPIPFPYISLPPHPSPTQSTPSHLSPSSSHLTRSTTLAPTEPLASIRRPRCLNFKIKPSCSFFDRIWGGGELKLASGNSVAVPRPAFRLLQTEFSAGSEDPAPFNTGDIGEDGDAG